MRIEVDQSGKIEETNRDTIIAAANGATSTIRITARTKRRVQDMFRKLGVPRSFIVTVFVYAIFELLKPYLKSPIEVTIDTEYPGYEPVVGKILYKLVQEHHLSVDSSIQFRQVGKGSPAHYAAYGIRLGKSKANQTLSYNYFIAECFINKNGYPVLKHPITKEG